MSKRPLATAAAALGLCAGIVAGACTSAAHSDGSNAENGAQAPDTTPALAPSHGVMIAELRGTRARVWSRGERAGWMQVRVEEWPAQREVARAQLRVDASTDFTGSLEVTGLVPHREHRVWVRFCDRAGRAWTAADRAAPHQAQFHTPPAPNAEPSSVRFAFGGDLGGQNVGRDAQRGYAIFEALTQRDPDFFIALGDMIYGDAEILATGRFGNAQVPGEFGPAVDLEGYRAHWRYNRADAALQRFFARTPCFAVWDDHEVVNDFGPADDTRDEAPYSPGQHLMPIGAKAFLEFNPIAAADGSFYRSVRWGPHVELFLLDNRSHRDSARERDDLPQPKTQLGMRQLAWLENALSASDATWKFVVSSVPISIPTGSAQARDGWANADSAGGYERELALLFATLRVRSQQRTIWLTTDVHFATGFEYTPFHDAPEFHVREFVVGPLAAGLFPTEDVDPTFRPRRLYFHGPQPVPQDADGALRAFNFGLIEIDASGRLTLSVVDGTGEAVAGCTLDP